MATVYDFQGWDFTQTIAHITPGTTSGDFVGIVSGGRFGGNRLGCGANIGTWARVGVFTSVQTLAAGFALNLTSLASSNIRLFAFSDSGSLQVEIGVDASGRLIVLRGGGTLIATDTAHRFEMGLWYYVEFKAKIDNTTGTYEVKVNGDVWLTATAQDTQTSANASANGYSMGSFGGNCGRIYFDDFWVASDYLGDIRVDLLIPTAEGNTTQMTPLSGTDNALMADETPPDDDTTYNSSATAGDKDTYVTSNVSSAGTIHGLRLRARARKTDAGARSIATVIRSGGTDYDGTTTGLGTAYLYYSTDYYTNPNTAAAWTSTEVNAIEIGAKVAA